MKKEDMVRLEVASLHKKLHEAEKLRQHALSQVNAIKELCTIRAISFSSYEAKLSEKIEGFSLPEWIQYYDNYIKTCETRINCLAL